MNIEELQELFRIGINENKTYTPRFNPLDRPIANYKHLIYPFKALDQLIKKLQQIAPDAWDEEDDLLTRFSARFTMEENGALWFAREGSTGYTVPNHAQMSNSCIAAGRIIFSKDYQTIIGISNQSGHFMPNFTCLVWVIAALFYVNAPLGEHITIGMCDTRATLLEIPVTRASLFTSIPIDMLDRELMPHIIQPQIHPITKESRVNDEYSRPFRRQRINACNLDDLPAFPRPSTLGVFRPEPRKINNSTAHATTISPSTP